MSAAVRQGIVYGDRYVHCSDEVSSFVLFTWKAYFNPDPVQELLVGTHSKCRNAVHFRIGFTSQRTRHPIVLYAISAHVRCSVDVL